MTFPSPIAFWIGNWPVHWYGLSYGIGILAAWQYCRTYVLSFFPSLTKKDVDDFVGWGMLGIVIGGRLGHVLFYYPGYYITHPLEIFAVWRGGMAFHGGLIGVLLAFLLFCSRRHLSFLSFSDLWACGAPIGLFFGRVANFINQELFGKPTTLPWGVVFPKVDSSLRHPSQLYEAFLEGILLWIVLAWVLSRCKRRPGVLSGLFLIGYAAARWISEYFREPLETASFLGMPEITLGQLYSVPFVLLGVIFLMASRPKK
jgi:phosphatidylglycerol:prolipoprotein diacylglycerol transferase